MSRTESLMHGVSKTEKLVEIGPSLNPLAPKADGWNSFSIDHADQAGLRAKYKHDPSVDPLKIEHVDYVWQQGSLSDAVPAGHLQSFDVFLASHVIEHFPNLVDFLDSAEALTKPQGRMVLAIPDKRLCFDMFRSLSNTGEAIAAHLEKRTRHTCANVFDFVSKAVVKNGLPGWVITDTTATSPISAPFELAHAQALAAGQEVYIDAHSWVFCPASFQLIMVELARLGYTDWQVERCVATPATEFHAWLTKGAKAHYQGMAQPVFDALRTGLLTQTLLELAEQSKTLLAAVEHDVAPAVVPAAIVETLEATAAASVDADSANLILALQTEINSIKSSKLWRLRHGIKRYLSI
jgi:predicted SAM-dependent methyltransferase